MTEDVPPTAPKGASERPSPRRGWRPRTPHGLAAAVLALVVLMLGAAVLIVRYGPLTSVGRTMVEASVDGLKLGRFGRLKIEGLQGDVWTRFSVRRLTVSDDQGPWLEARNLKLRWHYGELLARRVDVPDASAEVVRILKRPRFDTSGKSQPMPVSVHVGRVQTRLELLAAFSGVRGVYDTRVQDFALRRSGAMSLIVAANSVLHPGDFLRSRLDLGRTKTILLEADAVEAQGGALAGALGLLPDQPFSLQARAGGTLSNGRLTVVSRSGDAAPLVAQGVWNPQGGSASATVQFSASKWTRGLVEWFGPEAQLAVFGRRKSAGVYDFDVRAVADNLLLTATGPVVPAKVHSDGMRTEVSVGSLSRLYKVPPMGPGPEGQTVLGPAHAIGTISGTFTNLGFSAPQAQVTDIVSGRYRLPRVTGSAEGVYRNGQLDVRAKLVGQGGNGAGWRHAVSGAAPRADLAISRLKDGRVLMRSVDATGEGMRLKASGGQGFFGALSFKGDLEVFNLAAAQKGAGGSAKIGWQASQKNAKSPWTISLDGAGAKFTSGFGELDRLLGPSPKVKVQATFLDGVLSVSKGVLNGAAADLQASGVQAANGQLKFAGDWNAAGPFTVGPLEISGKMTGKASLAGTVEAPQVAMTADFASLQTPALTVRPGHIALSVVKSQDGYAGGIALNGDSDFGPAWAKAGFRFVETGVDLSDIDAAMGGARLRGALALRANLPSSADLTVDLGPGAWLTSGQAGAVLRIVDQPGGPNVDLRLQTAGAVLRGAALSLERAQITASGPLARLPYKVSGSGLYDRTPLVLDGGGQVAQQDQNWTISFAGSGQARTAKFKTTEPALFRAGPDQASARVHVALGGGLAQFESSRSGDAISITAALQKVDIGFLSEDFAGRFDADLSLKGRGRQLAGTLNASLDNARSRDAGPKLGMSGQIKAALTDNRLIFDSALTGEGGLKASANAVVYTEASAQPFRIAIVRTAPIQGRFDADGEIQPLWDLFMGGERTLGGHLITKASVAGTFNDPKITGEATLSDGRFEDYATGLKLSKLTVLSDMQSDVVQVRQFAADDGKGGTVSGSGRLNLNRGAAGDFTLGLKAFRLIDNDTATATATGEVTLTRAADGQLKIAGKLGVDQAQINAAARLSSNVPTLQVVEVNRPDALITQLPPQDRAGPSAALDVQLSAPRRIVVKGRGLDVEMSLAARVTGTTTVPILSGTARLVRGDYQFAGKRFEFDDRGLVQLSTNPSLIRLDLSATREDPSLTAVIKILGTAAKPEITLTSTPVLPNDEVLSQVLFGRSASQLSPLEAAQLASALTSLAAGGGFDVIGGLRSLAGLDRLALAGGGGSQSAVSVAGGKYLTDNVYLELAGGGRDGPSAEVDYRVSRKLSILSRISSQGGAKLAVRWRRDLADRKRGR